jgi:hypothetical protein
MRSLFSIVLVLSALALVTAGVAGGAAEQKGKPSLSATPVFKVHMKPSQEVPPIRGLRASAKGHITFDLERSSSGAITAGEVVFYVNYSFPSAVTISGLHIHQGAKGANGPIVVNSGVTSITDADGRGNITTVVSGTPAVLQAILDNPRGYYVNLHTTTPPHPGGAVRAQLHNPKKG